MQAVLHTFAHLFHPRRSNNHRPKVLHPEALTYLAGIALIFSLALNFFPRVFSPLERVLGYASNISSEQVIALTNQERTTQGLSPVTYSEVLSRAAEAKARDMFTNQYWAHTSPTGKEPWAFITEAGYTYRVAGENLARDFAVSDQVVAAWMASPTHRANIVSERYKEIGVAVVNGTLEGVETTLVVQMFGSPRTTATAVVPAAQTEQLTQAPAEQEVTQPTTRAPEVSVVLPPSLETTATESQVGVLGSGVVPESILQSPLVSPLQLTKAFFLSMLLLLIATLVYDLVLVESRGTVRFVGKNIAHIALFSLVAFLIIFFKGGVVG